MSTRHKYWLVIPAAGSGKRMATDVPKQYLKINGITILDHSINQFIEIPEIERIIVVLAENDSFWSGSTLANHNKIETTTGGKERYHTVLNGLKHISSTADDDDWVLVHDAARPCVRKSDINNLIKELRFHDVGGLLALPAKDTMKRAGKNNEIVSTVDRNDLWHALTPQMFKFSDLQRSLKKMIEDGIDVTDEAYAIESLGLKPKLVPGHPANIKVTHENDIALATLFLNEQEGSM